MSPGWGSFISTQESETHVFAQLPASRQLGKGDPYGNGQAKTASDEPRAGPYGHQGSRSRARTEP